MEGNEYEEPQDNPGSGIDTMVQADYFGVDRTERVILEDGVSYVDVQELDEGGRRKYLNKSNRDIRLERSSGDAHLRMATGDERAILLDLAIFDWNLRTKDPKTGQFISPPCNNLFKSRFLEKASPMVLDKIEKVVRDINPWLMPAEMTVEAIDEQIEELQREREKLVEREEGKDT
jgi:hypothetical protein